MRRALAFAPVVLATALAHPASAAQVSWVDWTSSDANSVYGVARVGTTTVGVTYTGERGFVQTSCGANYWIASTATNPYTSAIVDNPPDESTDPAVRCDIIALSRATPKTLEFSQAVTNPLFAVVSLNGNGYRFDRDFDIISFAPGYWGTGTLSKTITTNADGSITYDLIGSGEPHGVIQFIGTFRTVSWSSLSNEYWNGFSIAIENLAVNVPPELEVYARGSTLTAGQPTPVDFGAHPTGTGTVVLFTIANSGTGPLDLIDLTVDGAAFSVGRFPPAIAAGAAMDVEVTFTASTAATSTATLTLLTNDLDEGTFTVPLLGAARIDSDGDGVLDRDDDCPNVANPDQADLDQDGLGDACDDDDDGDGVPDAQDLCPAVADPAQADLDQDGLGDACDDDDDGDGVPDLQDVCPGVADAAQADLDQDGLGDACDDDDDGDGVTDATDCDDRDATVSAVSTSYADDDGDGLGDPTRTATVCGPAPAGYVSDGTDNCPAVANPDQADLDQDGLGDVCDPDVDGDGALTADDCDDRDRTVVRARTFFSDRDGDGVGDPDSGQPACTATIPAGRVPTDTDNCPDVPNADQADTDGDGLGDACDTAQPTPSPSPSPTALPEDPDAGCACASTSAPRPEALLLFLAIGLWWVRRR